MATVELNDISDGLIYLASPYSHHVRAVRELRYKAAAYMSAWFMLHSQMVFSPITHSHGIALEMERMNKSSDEHGAWDTWKKFDEFMLASCGRIAILVLRDWQKSKGLAAEIAFARQHDILIEAVIPTANNIDLDKIFECGCLNPTEQEIRAAISGDF